MINQFFVDLASNEDNYNEILAFCKNVVNPGSESTITRLIGKGSNGKGTLMNLLFNLTSDYEIINPNMFTKAYLDTLPLTNPMIILVNEENASFFSKHEELIKNLHTYTNLHIVYTANEFEPLLANLNTIVKTIYMMQHVDDRNIRSKMLAQREALHAFIINTPKF